MSVLDLLERNLAVVHAGLGVERDLLHVQRREANARLVAHLVREPSHHNIVDTLKRVQFQTHLRFVTQPPSNFQYFFLTDCIPPTLRIDSHKMNIVYSLSIRFELVPLLLYSAKNTISTSSQSDMMIPEKMEQYLPADSSTRKRPDQFYTSRLDQLEQRLI